MSRRAQGQAPVLVPSALTSIDPVPPATERMPAVKETKRRTPSGKWPDKIRQTFVLFRLFLALPAPMFLLFTGTHEVRENRNRRSLNVSLVIPLVPLQD
jgi:hypothetical protein